MKERSKFYSSLGLLVLLNIIVKPVWIFLIDRQVQNEVGTEAYGIYFSLLNLSVVFSFFLDWGMTAFLNRELAAGSSDQMISRLLITKMFFILVYLLMIGLLGSITKIAEWSILWKVAAIQVFTSSFIFLRAIITARQWFRTDAWLSVLDKSIMIIVCAGFLYLPLRFGSISIQKFLDIQLLTTVFAVIVVSIILLRRSIQLLGKEKRGIGFSQLKSVLPFGLIVLLMSAHYRLDGFLLEQLHTNGAYEAGIYAGAYRLLDAANMIGYLFASFLLPFISSQYSIGQNITEPVLISRHLLVLFAILIACVAIFMAPWVQELLYHNSNSDAIEVIQLCLPALLGYSLVQVYGTVLTATGRIVPFSYIVLVSLIINTGLNLWLIPDYGAKGVCITALISQGFCGIATMIYASKKCKLPLHFNSLLIYIFTGLVISGMLYLSVNSGINEWVAMAGTGLVALGILFITGLFKLRHWNHLFKPKNAG